MRPVSDAFREAIAASHPLAVKVEVLRAGIVLATLTTVASGTVTLDAGASIRGRCDLTLTDDGIPVALATGGTSPLVPTGPTDLLAPYGNELRIWRGLYLPGATEPELVSLGIFRIDDTNVDEAADGLTITLGGLDRAARISDARFEEPYQVAAGTNVGTAVAAILTAAYPDITMSFAATSATTPQLIAEEGSDRWEFATSLAKSAGLRLYFDGDGVAVLAPEVTGGAPVVRLAEGAGIADDEAPVLVTASRKWNREGVFNRVIATGENTGLTAPVRGVATDDNPQSPTYYYGPMGQIPRFYFSPLITTAAQAADAAESILARELGTTQRVDFGSFVLPHLEPGDVARIARQRIGVDEDHIIDSLTIPLGPADAMTGTTRAVIVS